MSTKGKGWWIVLVAGFLIVSVFGWVIFRKYYEYLPYISHDHAAWGSFGSLLSAFITLAGFIITIATLVFLNSQNDWQKKTQGFDWYIKHRQLFMERLKELQATLGEQVRFRNPEKLYEGIFPDHYLEMAGFAHRPRRSEQAGKLLDRVAEKLNALDVATQKTEWNRKDAVRFAVDLIDASWDLEAEWVGGDSDGDIIWNGRNSGVNIYSVDETTARLHLIYDSMLRFGGRPEYEGFKQSPLRFLREALVDAFNRETGELISVVKNSPFLSPLENLLVAVRDIKDIKGRQVLPRTYNRLLIAIRSRDAVKQLSDAEVVSTICDKSLIEASTALEHAQLDEENRDKLTSCLFELDALHIALAYNGIPMDR